MSNSKEIFKLSNPAFLIGNGINYHSAADDMNLSWTKLLIDLFPEKYKKEIIKQKKDNKSSEFNLEGITYPEIAELALRYLKNDSSPNNKPEYSIKKQICIDTHNFEINLLSKLGTQNRYESIINFAKENSIPILTTNYDFLLLKPLKLAKSKRKVDYLHCKVEEPFWIGKYDKSNRKPYHHPFNAYFRETEFTENSKIQNEFAVWYIHGMKRYSSSLCIRNTDYNKKIAKINEYIKKYDDIQKSDWKGKGTWLNPFMNNDLLIIGLGLDSSETDLRWLLLERFLYQEFLKKKKKEYIPQKTIYVYSDDKEMPIGKRKLFESIGIECVKKTYDEVYTLDYIKIAPCSHKK